MDKLNEKEVKRCKMLLDEIEDLFYAINLELNHNDTGYVSRKYLKEKMSGITTDIKCFNSILKEEQIMNLNEYIRFNGKINKIVEIKQVEDRTIVYLDNGLAYNSNDLKKAKHRFNILDLIEKGDYVNGCKVYEIEGKGITVYQEVEHSSTDYNYISYNDIISIVTKEQFNSRKYVLEE